MSEKNRFFKEPLNESAYVDAKDNVLFLEQNVIPAARHPKIFPYGNYGLIFINTLI